MSALIWFILVTILNVVTYTAKTLITVKGSKLAAASINGINSVVYILLIIYAVTDVPLPLKLIITAICNFIGVYIIKWIEEKMQKDKLWKIEATIKSTYLDVLKVDLASAGISFNYIDVKKYIIFNIYCATPAESSKTKKILDRYNAKYFASETKLLV